MENISVEVPQLTALQKAKSKYYFKNKEAISSAYKVYYQQNKEEIARKRREKNIRTRAERTRSNLTELVQAD